MSLTEFFNGRMIMDYTGKLAPVRIRIDQNDAESASSALSNIINLISNGRQIVETGEYNDYQIIQSFPDNSANNFNCFRLTLVDNMDSSVKEYVYIPSAKLEVLSNNLEYIPDTSSLFQQIASYIQPYYKSRLGNGCTLTAIDYVIQRNTIFPSQIGAATFAPQQVKTTNITENGSYTVEPDPGYILGRNIINVNVPSSNAVTFNTLYSTEIFGGSISVTPENFIKYTSSLTLTVNPGETIKMFWFRINVNYPTQNTAIDVSGTYIARQTSWPVYTITINASTSQPYYIYYEILDSYSPGSLSAVYLRNNNDNILRINDFNSAPNIGDFSFYDDYITVEGGWW